MINNESIYANNIKSFPKYARKIIKEYGQEISLSYNLSEDDKYFVYAKYLWAVLRRYKQEELCKKPNKDIQRFITDQYNEFSIFTLKNNRFIMPPERNVSKPNIELEMIPLSQLTDPYDLMTDYFLGCAIERTFNNTWLCYSNCSKRIFVVDENLYFYNLTGGKEEVIKNNEILVPFEYAYNKNEIPDFTYSLYFGEYRMLSIFTTKLKPFYKDFIKCFDKRFINRLDRFTY